MQNLIQLIHDTNYQEIISICSNLNDSERYETVDYLKSLDIDKDILKQNLFLLDGNERDKAYAKRVFIDKCYNFALVACSRNYSDIKNLDKIQYNWHFNSLQSQFASCNIEALIQFYSLFPPDYLDKFFVELTKERFNRIDFKLIWKLHEKGWLALKEDLFLRSLLVVHMFDRNTQTDADFLFENPQAIKKVLLSFYKHEMPVLDISKWTAREGFVCKKVVEYWTEVFVILLEKGFHFDREIVPNLLQSLLNHWKKPHLDWHVRILELFKPNQEELLANQNILFAILGTGNPSLINVAINKIHTIHTLNGFEESNFIDNFSLIFTNEKCAKSILIGLNITEKILSNNTFDYSENLGLLLMQSDAKVQEKAASLLVRFCKKESLQEIALPYLPYLKQKTKEILSVSEILISDEILTNIESDKHYKEVNIPQTWNDLFYHLGTCIKTKSPLDTDLFFEGLNQLQNDIPTDYVKQLQPFTKQLTNKFWNDDITRCLCLFVEAWTTNSQMKPQKDFNTIPFLWNKCDWMIQKLKNKNGLPLLSTPTHEPFYVHPNILIERLLQYEEHKTPLHLEDLIVACNRLMLDKIDTSSLELVKKLKGSYSNALQYYFGVSDEIIPSEIDLPLWTQITRIKNPNKEFPIFETTKAKDIPSVVKPFYLGFYVKNDTSYWNMIMLDYNWNYSWFNKQSMPKIDFIFYNSAPTKAGVRSTIPYQLSLNPHYIDAFLCKYIPSNATHNEVNEFENCSIPLQFLLENNIKIHHSGWIYIATCLIFEKKISRDLAAEYIQIALIQRNENLTYLAEVVGKFIAQKYAPINRLIEYFDKPFVAKSIQLFQHLVLEKCIEHFEIKDLPTNSKKVFTYYEEWATSLNLEVNKNLLGRFK